MEVIDLDGEKIQIVPVTGETLERTDRQIKTLITTIEGTMPRSRGFGMSGDFIDMPPDESINEFAVDLQEKIDTYIPEIAVQEIKKESNEKGETTMQIYIERGEEDGK